MDEQKHKRTAKRSHLTMPSNCHHKAAQNLKTHRNGEPASSPTPSTAFMKPEPNTNVGPASSTGSV